MCVLWRILPFCLFWSWFLLPFFETPTSRSGFKNFKIINQFKGPGPYFYEYIQKTLPEFHWKPVPVFQGTQFCQMKHIPVIINICVNNGNCWCRGKEHIKWIYGINEIDTYSDTNKEYHTWLSLQKMELTAFQCNFWELLQLFRGKGEE